MTESQESSDPDEPRPSARRNAESADDEAQFDRKTDGSIDEPPGRMAPETRHADDGAVAPEPMSTPVLSGQIEREHAAFVVLGALATVAVFFQLSGIWL